MPSHADLAELVLLLGGKGMLGHAIATMLDSHRVAYHAPGRGDLDLAHERSIADFRFDKYSMVVNAAAMTDVDGCEDQQELANLVNGTAVGHLATCCSRAGIPLIHFSTDYVFDGRIQKPYTTADIPNPLNAYGRSKLLGEQLVQESSAEWLVIRTSWLYGPWGKNFVLSMANLLSRRDSIQVVDDQVGRPTSVENLATYMWDLWNLGARGIVHVTDGGQCSWYELACEVKRLGGYRCGIEPCTTDQFPRKAKRPSYSVLDLVQTELLLGRLTDWKRALDDVLSKLE